jgi:hypothetical protein
MCGDSTCVFCFHGSNRLETQEPKYHRHPAFAWRNMGAKSAPSTRRMLMATREAQLSESSRKALARHLRKSFEGNVLPHVLEKLSDDDLIRQYFANAESKKRAIAEKSKRLRDRLKKDSEFEVL